MGITEAFYNCSTKQDVQNRIKAMSFEEIRDIMTSYSCSVGDVERVVCRQLKITK